MGAFLAARIALDHPELVRTLVLVDTNTTAPDDPRHPWTAFYEDLAAKMPPGAPTRETVRMEPEAQSFSTEHVTDDWVDRMTAFVTSPKNREALELRHDVREGWMGSILPARKKILEDIDAHGLPVPTLVIWAWNDLSAPWPLATALFERIVEKTTHAELHLFSHAGHYVYRERPREFERLLDAFCGSV
jgi:pimeloyl-ACP methyl ester carboxylesterase